MRRLIKRYCMTFDILLALNFFGTVAAVFGAAVSDGDIKMTVIMGALNTLVIILSRIGGYEVKRDRKELTDGRC